MDLIRLKLLKKHLVSNGGALSKGMRKAGYSEAYIRSNKIKHTKAYKHMEKDLLSLIKEKKALAIEHITSEKLQKESGQGLSVVAKNLDHIENLMQGTPTDISYTIVEGDTQEDTE
jgi:hypothetical protein